VLVLTVFSAIEQRNIQTQPIRPRLIVTNRSTSLRLTQRSNIKEPAMESTANAPNFADPMGLSSFAERMNLSIAVTGAPLEDSALTPVLLVIDMQTGFNASYDKGTQKCVLELIQRAIHCNALILIVEFVLGEPNVCGKTHRCLTDPLLFPQRYAGLQFVTKHDVDGSADVVLALENLSVGQANIVACGTSTHGCVQSTVEGLSARLPQSRILVAKEACHQDLTGNDWRRFPNMMNVTQCDRRS
jgi:nicotinamidase-related amidase